MWQARPDDDDRQPGLADFMGGGTQGGDILRGKVLHLIEEDRHPSAGVRGEPADIGKQFDEVDLDVPRVGAAGHRGGVDTGVPALADATARVLPLRKGLDHAQHVRRLGVVGMAQLADRLMDRRTEGAAQRLIRPRLQLAGPPTRAHSRRTQRIEEHGLADPAQPGEDDRALRAATGNSLQHHVEGLELLIPPGEFGWALARPGGIGVANWIHDRSVFGYLASAAYIARERHRVSHTRLAGDELAGDKSAGNGSAGDELAEGELAGGGVSRGRRGRRRSPAPS